MQAYLVIDDNNGLPRYRAFKRPENAQTCLIDALERLKALQYKGWSPAIKKTFDDKMAVAISPKLVNDLKNLHKDPLSKKRKRRALNFDLFVMDESNGGLEVDSMSVAKVRAIIIED